MNTLSLALVALLYLVLFAPLIALAVLLLFYAAEAVGRLLLRDTGPPRTFADGAPRPQVPDVAQHVAQQSR